MFTYKSLFPSNQKDNYTEFDSVDFFITGADMESLICNSIRLEGVLDVNNTTAGVNPLTDKVYIDCLTGAHNLVESITTETQNKGVIENFTNYGRYVKMLRVGSITPDDTLNASYVSQLCAPNEYFTTRLLEGVVPYNTTNSDIVNNVIQPQSSDFSFKPEFCLNRAVSGDGSIPLLPLKNGYVKVNIKFSRVFELLYGESVDSTYSYNVSDLRMTYRTVMEQPSAPLTMRTTSTFKTSAQSGLTNISARVPAICDSMVVSFILQEDEQTPQYNNLALQEIPNINFVDYVYNDSSNSIITYQIKDRIELLDRALEALRNTGKNSASVALLKSNDSFMLGLNFNQFIDFTQQKLSLNMSSNSVNNTLSYSMYFYFNGIQQL